MNELQVFAFNDHLVRTVQKEGEPWWVAKDVCEVLDLARQQDSVRYLDDDEKGVCLVNTPGGSQEMTIVSEAGLYSLILRSRKPEAKEFKRWVTHEVLPTIRKTGGYGARAQIEGLMARCEGKISKYAMGKLALMAATEITGQEVPTRPFDDQKSMVLVNEFLCEIYPTRPVTVPALTIFNEYQRWLNGRGTCITEKHQLGSCLRRLGMVSKLKWIGNPKKRPKGLCPTVRCYTLVDVPADPA